MTDSELDDLIGVTDVARLLGKSEQAVRDGEKRGALPRALRVSGSTRIWHRRDVDLYMEARAAAAKQLMSDGKESARDA